MMYEEMPGDSTEVKILKADIRAMKEKLPKMIKEARVEVAEKVIEIMGIADKPLFEINWYLNKEIISTNKESK